jgi:HNH endonuclease
MWEIIHGPIIGNLDVLHTCDNTSCVRPDHLYLGTPADNAHDRDTRGRNKKAKLTTDDVRLARAAYAAGWTNARLARQFGISAGHMHAILHGQAWKHVD